MREKGTHVKSLGARLLLVIAALVVVVSGCGVASKNCPPASGSAGGSGSAGASGSARGSGTVSGSGSLAVPDLNVHVPGDPTAELADVAERGITDLQAQALEAACGRGVNDRICLAKLKALLPYMTALCPRPGFHECIVVAAIVGQGRSFIKVVDSGNGGTICAGATSSLCDGKAVSDLAAADVTPAASPPVTPSTTVSPVPTLSGTPAPAMSSPPAGSTTPPAGPSDPASTPAP